MEIEINGMDELKKKLKELENLGDQEIMAKIGDEGVKIIVERTLSGKDVDHGTFINYSNEYMKQKKKGNPPNLKDRGEMLATVKGRVTDGLTVSVQANTDVGLRHQAGIGKMPIRRWFGLDHSADVDKIKELFEKLMTVKIEKKWNR